MNILSAAMLAELGLTVTRPGYLVQIDFDAYTARLSSFGDVNWSGQGWVNSILELQGLSWDESGNANGGRLAIGNLDNAFGALALLHDVADRPIKIWKAYAGALAPADPVQIFDGVGDECEIGVRRVQVSLAVKGSNALQSPREFYGPATGFHFLPPIGEEILFNGELFKLDREEF